MRTTRSSIAFSDASGRTSGSYSSGSEAGPDELEPDRLSGDARWRHEVARASQVFVGRCVDADPAYFVRAVRVLAREMPAATTHAQRDVLRKELVECASNAALYFHAEYHRTIEAANCPSAPMKTLSILLKGREIDPRLLVRLWARAFIEDINLTHPWPAAVHAAIVLRKRRRRWIRIERLCSSLGVSKTAIAREFRHLYGISVTEYHRRAKMRWVAAQLAESEACIEAIALGAGYKSAGSLYETCWALTGLSPAQMRRLPPDDMRELLDGPLSLRMGRSPAPSLSRLGPGHVARAFSAARVRAT